MVIKMSNPLSQYFRQPSIYVKLPSNGQFYPPGTLDLPANGELPVLPMTAVDEITYRTPDALYNGSATVSVIQSCIPNIKDAWKIPSTDIDTLLIAIRIASYGHELEVKSTCPKCTTTDEHSIDLRAVLDRLSGVDFSQPLEHGDLIIYFSPMTYQQINSNSAIQFEEQKLLSLLPDSELDPAEKAKRIGEAFKKITEMSISALSLSIKAIVTPTAQVTENEHILDFLHNCDRSVFEQIKDKIISLKSASEIQPLKLKCNECSHEYEQTFTLDMTNFFV
jgi:hypothetical protein